MTLIISPPRNDLRLSFNFSVGLFYRIDFLRFYALKQISAKCAIQWPYLHQFSPSPAQWG
jgi:hypothetical protein